MKEFKIIRNLIVILSALFILWFIVSWVEIATHNSIPNYTYSVLNIFKLITGK